MQSLCFSNVNYSDIKVITHMRHRIIVSFEITPHTASLQAGFMAQYRLNTLKSLSKMNILCNTFLHPAF